MNETATFPSRFQQLWNDRHGAFQTALYVVLTLLFLAFGVIEWERIDASFNSVARERGRVLFNLIELTRDWNASHGGVYVPVGEQAQPNAYLEHPQRDLTSGDGLALTMVNPAYMTRQLAELAEKSAGVRFHITSLKPIRPANAADTWETGVLRNFESLEEKERIDFFDEYSFSATVTRPVHRYMAPLVVKQACLKCHEKQNYRIGDIRGGISVTMPAEDLLIVRDQQRRGSLLIVLGGFVVTTILLYRLFGHARRNYLALMSLAEQQDGIITARTHEIAERHRELQGEIDERRRREKELRIADAVFESAVEGIVVTNAENRIVRVNPAFTVITGYTPKEVMGRNPGLLKSGRHDQAFYAEMWSRIKDHGHWEGEIWNRHKNGNVYVAWLSITRIDVGQDEGQYLSVFHDITRRKQAEDLLRFKAHHDVLTELPNRELFNDRLLAALNQCRRYNREFALLLIDLDHFKEANDTFGHLAGDVLLVEAARRLVGCVRESDTVARLGGDEFAIILSETTTEREAEQIAQRAVMLLAEPYYLDNATARISGSIGIALYPRHGQDGEQLCRNADMALYAAKKAGRNTYRVYSSPSRNENPQRDLI